MKSIKTTITLGLLCLFAEMPVGATTRTMTYTLSFSPSDFTVQTINGDTSIITSTKYSLYSEYDPTLPELPVIYVTLLLPRDASYAGFTCTKGDNPFLPGVILINGSEPRSYSALPPFPLQNQWYPSQIYPSSIEFVQTTSLPGYRMVTFKVKSIRYNAIDHDLMIANYTLYIQLEDAEIQSPTPSKRGANERGFVENKIWNTDSLQLWYASVPTSLPTPNIDGSIPKDKYLIITCDSLRNAFEPLRKWKETKGLDADIVTTETIQTLYPSLSPVERIKAYLSNWYNNTINQNDIDFYVLLGGDVDIVPVYYSAADPWNYTSVHCLPCDMYYACINNNGNWLHDYQELYIEGHYPYYNDLWVSRASVKNNIQVNSFCKKIINYESNPQRTNEWGDKILFLGQRTFEEDDDSSLLSYISDNVLHPIWNGTYDYYYSNTNSFNLLINDSLARVHVANLMQSNYSFISEMSHGTEVEWLTYSQKPILDTTCAKNLSTIFPKIIVTSACHTNAFDRIEEKGPSLSESLMRNINSGIIGYIGSSREGYPANPNNNIQSSFVHSNAFLKDFVESVFSPYTSKNKNLGKMVDYAKQKLNYQNNIDKKLLFSINTLGDPEMPIYIHAPKTFDNITCIMEADSDYFSISPGISGT